MKYLILIGIFLIATAAGYFMLREAKHESDTAMIATFYANREAFDEVVNDRRETIPLVIGGWRESLSVYRDRGRVELCCVSHLSWPIDGQESYVSSKGFVYSEAELSPLQDSLDERSPTGSYYRHIEGNWYIIKSNGYSKPE
ncbi:MAG: hypothetical protein IPM21_07570 [Acidobacteria bacterium]|nr:hypothetical protein [Acidobacteriota bacterium]